LGTETNGKRQQTWGLVMAFYLTLSEAAKQTGRSKETLSRAIKEGRLSVVEKTERGFKLDPAEVFRLFQPKQTNVTSGDQHQTVVNEATQKLITHLEETIKQLQQDKAVAAERELCDRRERERLLGIIEGLKLLEAPKAEPEPQQIAEPERKGWFSRLFS